MAKETYYMAKETYPPHLTSHLDWNLTGKYSPAALTPASACSAPTSPPPLLLLLLRLSARLWHKLVVGVWG